MSTISSPMPISGTIRKRVIRNRLPSRFWWKLRQAVCYRWRELPFLCCLGIVRVVPKLFPGVVLLHGCVRGRIIKRNGDTLDLGIIGRHLITTVGRNFVRDAFLNSTEAESMRFHGFGTGTTAAAIGDTTLQAELTTQYAIDNTRPTGSQAANGTGVYRSIGQVTVDASAAITEWGLFTQAATGGGTLLDRQVFSAVNLSSGDSLEITYDLTIG